MQHVTSHTTGDHSADDRRLNYNDSSTSGRNLMSLRPVTPEFTRCRLLLGLVNYFHIYNYLAYVVVQKYLICTNWSDLEGHSRLCISSLFDRRYSVLFLCSKLTISMSCVICTVLLCCVPKVLQQAKMGRLMLFDNALIPSVRGTRTLCVNYICNLY